MIAPLAAQGKANSNFIVQNSNNSVATQVSQLQSEIQSGCNVIFLNNNSTTAFCDQYTNAIAEERAGHLARPVVLQQRHHGVVRRVRELLPAGREPLQGR